ncbi:MAG: FixH family protein [Gammaproteobacteria bacterium]|nr:FixH family protein [Gammaproteobacteria bacterium]MBU1439870.1 FixH family protein [Gammaproteobacteria bacterium]MBU2286585.1 FixH family protein [Gammaproteobacteria bacterium]
MTQAELIPPNEPWWRHAMLWMVIAGPAIVVVASFVTLWLAIRTPDPVYETETRQGASAQRDVIDKKLLPALFGRNHAATPGKDLPPPRN